MSRLEQLRKLAALSPSDPFTHYGVGLECLALERWAEAITTFERVLALDPRYSAAYAQKARAELKLGRRPAATATLQAGIATAQASGETHAASEMQKTLETMA